MNDNNTEAGVRCVLIRGNVKDEYIPATFIGPFAAHKTVGNPFTYTLTHAATGFAVAIGFATERGAVACANRILPIADWNFTDVAVVKTWPADVLKKIAKEREKLNPIKKFRRK